MTRDVLRAIDKNVEAVYAAIADMPPGEGTAVLLWVAASITAKEVGLPTDPESVAKLAKAATEAFEDFEL